MTIFKLELSDDEKIIELVEEKRDPLLCSNKPQEITYKCKKAPIIYKQPKLKETWNIPKCNSFWRNRRKEIVSLEERISAIPKNNIKVNINKFTELQKRFDEKNKNLNIKVPIKHLNTIKTQNTKTEDKIKNYTKLFNETKIEINSESEDEFEK